MTWDDLYLAAEGAGHREPPLKAKDEARRQVRELMVDLGCPDPEHDGMPEEAIEEYCNKMKIGFDVFGNIISIQLPDYIEEITYRRKDDDYLRNDIRSELENRKDLPDVAEEMIEQMMMRYRKIADCNVPYNASIENAVDLVLKGE